MIITRSDHERLVSLLKAYRSPAPRSQTRATLRNALERARVVEPEGIPASVVTMNSIVVLIDIVTGEMARYTLVFPAEADVDRMKISVLAPLGAALLGRAEGEMVEYEIPSGLKRFFVKSVEFQPESRLRDVRSRQNAA